MTCHALLPQGTQRRLEKASWCKQGARTGRCRHLGAARPFAPVAPYLIESDGWQLIVVPRATVILDGSLHPGRPLQP